MKDNNEVKENKMNIKKIVYIVTGCICVGIGAVGAAVPILPSVPFLLIAAFCFGRSSEKLDTWFKGTQLYKKNLETYVKGQGMTRGAKIRIMGTVTLLMAIGCAVMYIKSVPIYAFITLGVVWLCHIIYFCFFVKKYDGDITADEKSAG